MQPVLNRQQIREYDRQAMSTGKVQGVVLMENAGRGAFEIITRLMALRSGAHKRIVIICGGGNNGGDGFVVARHLKATFATQVSLQVFVLAAAEQIKGDARTNLNVLIALAPDCLRFVTAIDDALHREVMAADAVIDALFGTGLSRAVTGIEEQAIGLMNAAPGHRFALDIPSGLDCDTGQALGTAVVATHTISFAYPKPGLLTPNGKEHCGQLHIAALGLPDAAILSATGSTAWLLTAPDIAALVKARGATTYKHRSGDVLLVAGSTGKTGAARLAAHAALRAGAGLATVCTWSEALPALAAEIKEIMLAPLERAKISASLSAAAARRDAIVIGPGLGLDADARVALEWVLAESSVPVIADADALTLIAQNPQAATQRKGPLILTPHSGELARLLSVTAAEIEQDRYAAVASAAEKFQCTVVLKGAHTLTANGNEIRVSPWANAALATAGSGDVLAGLTAALACHEEAFAAATAAVFLHGLAGEIWSQRHSADRGMLAGDIADLLPDAFAQLR